MHWITLQFASGAAMFYGVGILTVGALACLVGGSTKAPAAWRMVTICGVLGVALSSTPLPWWFYAAWAIPVGWLFWWLHARRGMTGFPAMLVPGAVILASLLAALLELPHHVTPTVDVDRSQRIVVLGDSLSAGVPGDGVRATWPAVLRGRYGLDVVNLAQAGMRLEGAVALARRTEWGQFGKPVVILEIGGNDLLGETTVREFAANWDALLQLVAATASRVLVLELPLPPLHNRYGTAQRDLARKHQAVLIPKRLFARVLGGAGSTVDGLHLSQRGHDRMAAMFWSILD